MPTYAYACTACDHRFEAQQSFTDSSLTVCPECEGRLRKVFPSVGVVFKGSGFYRNDSRSSNHGKIPASSTASHGDSGSSGSGSSDSGSASSSSESSSSRAAASAAPAAASSTASSGGSTGSGSKGSGSKVAASSGATTSK
ncbi:FmdB family zinc ribbon protein [Pengzhenrongella frigida]|uniref:FmdB family transcriptional regulator n=1 Tax=Pengzhenrongella frigida TaxID=1259133 RepID=A0A4Q5MXM4_9MICO|nr:FmdB family zinc ribbon protein [Cellulomonas sp. HLT2-17]RYV50390.1 FmdB family transcriptional regulator [Cellulomonas sp. HLT2-17]